MRTEDAKHWISNALEGTFNTAPATGSAYSQVPNDKAILHAAGSSRRSRTPGRAATRHRRIFATTTGRRAAISLATTSRRTCRRGSLPVHSAVRSPTRSSKPASMITRSRSCSRRSDRSCRHSAWRLLLDAASFLLHGCMVDSFKVSQSKDQRAQYEANRPLGQVHNAARPDVTAGARGTGVHGRVPHGRQLSRL
jgi:hypothetical protein